MSLIATFALMTTAVVAKLRPPNPDVEATKRIAELERQVEELEVRLDSAQQEAKDWEVVSSAWRARYEQTGFAQAQQLYAAMQNQAAMQYAMQNQMLAQQQVQSPYGQGLAQVPGMQAFDGFCNCVPSRAQVWHANRA